MALFRKTKIEDTLTDFKRDVGAHLEVSVDDATTLEFQITVAADGANRLPLLAGTYHDHIIITFKPQM